MTGETARKVAWVTGAGKGIGRAVAYRLAHDGWTVAVSARTAEDLMELVAECPHNRVHAYPLDVTDQPLTEITVRQITKQVGDIDLTVLNAGTYTSMSAEHFSTDTVRQLVETNLMGPVNCLAQIISKFIDRGSGHIAVVASVAGYRGLPTAAAYGATKAGLINMCEALKPELERHGVRLTLINPGFVKTPLTDKNDFPMPYLIPVEEAADRIMHGLRRDDFEVTFPWRFAILMKMLRLLPYRLFFVLTRRMIRG